MRIIGGVTERSSDRVPARKGASRGRAGRGIVVEGGCREEEIELSWWRDCGGEGERRRRNG